MGCECSCTNFKRSSSKGNQLEEIDVDLLQTCKNEAKALKQEQRRHIQHITKLIHGFLQSLPQSGSECRRRRGGVDRKTSQRLSTVQRDVTELEIQAATLQGYCSRGRLNPGDARAQLEKYMGAVQSLENDGCVSTSGGRSSGTIVTELRWDINLRLNRLRATLDVAKRLSSS